MAETILYGIAVEILQNLGSTALNEFASVWGFKAQLEKFKNTINTIKYVLLDAEQRQAHSQAVRNWLERLSSAVYAADDLFDEFATVASQKHQMHRTRNRLTKEVRTFFSHSNQCVFAFKISQKITRIRRELDDIMKDGTQFAFVLQLLEGGDVINFSRRDESYSFVDAEEVIGRDDDKKSLLDILLASSFTDADHKPEKQVLPVIPIVGIGGLGKTTLAQLIFNDPLVKENFELRLWVCVSEVFDVKIITEKILKSATDSETPKLEMDQLQGRVRKEVGDKKYLLVLDDIWDEDREKWLKLRALLKVGKNGSSIVVTTRSREVAKNMGTVSSYELHGLSEEKSWDLFELMAFEPGQAQLKPDLVKMGKEMVKKCANVPLAIRTLGSLLYGKDDSKWLSIKDTSLANITENHNEIMSILKLSYQHLRSPLKNCFTIVLCFPRALEFTGNG